MQAGEKIVVARRRGVGRAEASQDVAHIGIGIEDDA